MLIQVYRFVQLRQWEQGILARQLKKKMDPRSRGPNLSQIGIVFCFMVLFGFDILVGIASGTGGLNDLRKAALGDAVKAKQDMIGQRQTVIDQMKKQRDGKGVVLSDV
jgi:hypothetical protein